MSNLNSNFVKYFNLIIFFIFIFASVTLYNLYEYKTQTKKNYELNNSLNEQLALNTYIDKYKTLSTYILQQNIINSNLLELYYNSLIQNNIDEQRYLKGLLYKEAYNLFNSLKDSGIRQMHFHTKDNISFLRVHKPSKFNDDLKDIRKTVSFVNKTKKSVHTFETGRVLSGFRNVFPIFYNNQHLGSLEISFSLKSFIDFLENFNFNKEYSFILNSQLVDKKIFETEKYLYEKSNINSNFLIEDPKQILDNSPHKLSKEAILINKELSKIKDIEKKLFKKEKFLELVTIKNKNFNVVFLPIIGVENRLEAYLVSYSKAELLPPILQYFEFFILIVILGFLFVAMLLTLLKNKTLEVLNEKDWFINISEGLSEGLYVTDENSVIKYINQKACEILAYKKEELLNKNAHRSFHCHEKNNFIRNDNCPILMGIKKYGDYYSDDEFFKLKNGSLIPVEISSKKLNINKKEYEIVTVFKDLTLKKDLEKKTKLLTTAFNKCSDSIVITDIDANIQWANVAFEKLTGYDISEIIGKKPKEFVKSGFQSEEFYTDLWETILSNKSWKGELINKRKDNSLYYEELSITPICNEKNEIEHFIAVKQDITDKKNLEEKIKKYAYFDFLTNLPNRRLFMNYLQDSIINFLREDKYIAILFLDLDKFKILNDTKGHDFGDEVLKITALKLKNALRNKDVVSRLGGDEFVVILDHLPKDEIQAKEIVEKICNKIIESVNEKILIKEEYINIGISIGVFLTNDKKIHKDDALKNADIALYKAKNSGRNKFVIF